MPRFIFPLLLLLFTFSFSPAPAPAQTCAGSFASSWLDCNVSQTCVSRSNCEGDPTTDFCCLNPTPTPTPACAGTNMSCGDGLGCCNSTDLCTFIPPPTGWVCLAPVTTQCGTTGTNTECSPITCPLCAQNQYQGCVANGLACVRSGCSCATSTPIPSNNCVGSSGEIGVCQNNGTACPHPLTGGGCNTGLFCCNHTNTSCSSGAGTCQLDALPCSNSLGKSTCGPSYTCCGSATIPPLPTLPPAPVTCLAGEGIKTPIGCLRYGTGTDAGKSLVSQLVAWSVGVAGGIALLLIVYSAFQMTTASGDPKRVKAAQEMLMAALGGLALIILAVILLNFIGLRVLNLGGFGFSV